MRCFTATTLHMIEIEAALMNEVAAQSDQYLRGQPFGVVAKYASYFPTLEYAVAFNLLLRSLIKDQYP